MGRKVSVDMTCDRCGTSFEGNEIDLLSKDAAELVETTQEGLSETPAFTARLGDKEIRYDDLCDSCQGRVEGLFGDLGTVQRRGYTRKTPVQSEMTDGAGNGKEKAKDAKGGGIADPETETKGKGKGAPPKAAKPPGRPKPPPTAP